MAATVAINGAAGRMGRRLVALTLEHPELTLAGAIEPVGSGALGQDAGQLAGAAPAGVTVTTELPGAVDVIIDFSSPAGTQRMLEVCREQKIALVIGTTGLGPEHQELIDAAAKQIPVLQATNFSLVVNVLNNLAARAAGLLGDEYDIEILEAHHRFKKDAPSGTAKTLAKVVADATGRSFKDDVLYSRVGDDVPRKPRDITVQTLRLGDHVGEHTVYFAALGERLELKHVSTSRDSYARGAVRAAAWLAGKPAKRYQMTDVLGL